MTHETQRTRPSKRSSKARTQATVADRARHGGLGLGLAIVRNIAELHGGGVEASSAGEGKGATFTVRLRDHYGSTTNEGEKQ